MATTFHLNSAEHLDSKIVDTIKSLFKQKAITIVVEEDIQRQELTIEEIVLLEERMQEDESTYLSSKDSINMLKGKYGL